MNEHIEEKERRRCRLKRKFSRKKKKPLTQKKNRPKVKWSEVEFNDDPEWDEDEI